MFLRSARGMTTDTDAHLYTHTLSQTHRGGTYPQTQTSTIPLLSMLFDVRSSFLVSQCLYSSFSFTPMDLDARPFLTRGTCTPLEMLSLRSMDEGTTGRQQLSDRCRHAPRARSTSIHLDPPVRSIGTTLKKRLHRSIASYHDRSPPPRASTRAACHFWTGDEFQASFLRIPTETSSARNSR